MVVDDRDTYGGEVFGLAGDEILGAFDAEQHIRVFGGHLGRQHALISVGKIMGGHGVAVGPLGIGSKMERPSLDVLGSFPMRCNSGDGGGIDGIVARETLEEREHDIKVLQAVDDVRVQVGGLDEVSEMEDTVAGAAIDGGFAGAASHYERQGEETEDEGEGGTNSHGTKRM